jgi:hypothetical protein
MVVVITQPIDCVLADDRTQHKKQQVRRTTSLKKQ